MKALCFLSECQSIGWLLAGLQSTGRGELSQKHGQCCVRLFEDKPSFFGPPCLLGSALQALKLSCLWPIPPCSPSIHCTLARVRLSCFFLGAIFLGCPTPEEEGASGKRVARPMIPASIERPALAAQNAACIEEAWAHQLRAVAAAWVWGKELFAMRPENCQLSEEEARLRWIALAGPGGFDSAPHPAPEEESSTNPCPLWCRAVRQEP